MFCSIVAAVMAWRIKVPKVVLQMPATVPMIPGGSLYYTMYNIFAGDAAAAKTWFFFDYPRDIRNGDRLRGRERAASRTDGEKIWKTLIQCFRGSRNL